MCVCVCCVDGGEKRGLEYWVTYSLLLVYAMHSVMVAVHCNLFSSASVCNAFCDGGCSL